MVDVANTDPRKNWCCYVYCDDFTSPEEAKIEIEKVLGQK